MQAHVLATQKLFFLLGIFSLIASCTTDTQPANRPVPEPDIEQLGEGKQKEKIFLTTVVNRHCGAPRIINRDHVERDVSEL